MNLKQEFEIALAVHLKSLGREFPKYELSQDPLTLHIHQTSEDVEDHSLSWLEEDCAPLSTRERKAKLEQTARELVYFLEAPPGGLMFVTEAGDQTSLLPRSARKDLGWNELTREICPGVSLSYKLKEDSLRWLEERLKVKQPTHADDADILSALAGFMKERVGIEPLGKGAFVATGVYNDVALMAFDGLETPPLQGSPMALRLGGDKLFFAGADDAEALLRIAEAAQAVIESRSGPMIPDGQPLQRSEGEWVNWVPPRDMPEARSAFLEIRRAALEAQYEHQARTLSIRAPEENFAPLQRLPLAGARPTVARWIEGSTSHLPVADVYTLIPEFGSAQMVAGAELTKLVGRKCLGAISFDEESLLAPIRFTTVRFPNAEELKSLEPYSLDALACWEFGDG